MRQAQKVTKYDVIKGSNKGLIYIYALQKPYQHNFSLCEYRYTKAGYCDLIR